MEIEDLLSLIKRIYSENNLELEFFTANIFLGKATDKYFNYSHEFEDNSMEKAFGYYFKETLDRLRQLNFVVVVASDWYLFSVSDEMGIQMFSKQKIDKLTRTLQKSGFIRSTDRAISDKDVVWKDILPQTVHTVLIDTQKLKQFIISNEDKNNSISFDKEKAVLQFRKYEIKFTKDSYEAKTLALLIKNINSIVSKKEFHEISGKSYPVDISKTRLTPIHDVLKKRFLSLRKKIKSHPGFKKVIIFVQDDGFGIFINNKALIENSLIKD